MLLTDILCFGMTSLRNPKHLKGSDSKQHSLPPQQFLVRYFQSFEDNYITCNFNVFMEFSSIPLYLGHNTSLGIFLQDNNI
jgi:hypothetical protein